MTLTHFLSFAEFEISIGLKKANKKPLEIVYLWAKFCIYIFFLCCYIKLHDYKSLFA